MVFEKTTPNDGEIRVGRVNNADELKLNLIDKDSFISFLRFESTL